MRQIMVIALALMLFFPGCLDEEEIIEEEIIEEEVSEEEVIEEETKVPELITVPYEEGCDNLNPIHCMLPFPSNAFLMDDPETVTGYRLNYDLDKLPKSGQDDMVDWLHFEKLDGMSPATQILTAFSRVPDLSNAADQLNISRSMEADSPTILLDLNTGEKVPHWVEVDGRSDNPYETLVFVRTIEGLEHNNAYAIGIRDLVDTAGNPINPSKSFQAIRDGNLTTAKDIEDRRDGLESMFIELADSGFERSSLLAAWEFHTASTEALTGDMLHMRADALERLGEDGIGCNITFVEENPENDDLTYKRFTGTFTVPQYVLGQEPPTLMSRDENDRPQFVEYAEVPFGGFVPYSLANESRAGPLVTYGHGFLGTGIGVTEWQNLRERANEYGFSVVATDWTGWSSNDYDTIKAFLANMSYLQAQSDRLHQAMINKIALTRTFKGVCSDIPEFKNADNVNLVDNTDLQYMGYSLGGIYGGTFLTLSPDIDRGVFWVGGTSFSQIVERSTHYYSFEQIFQLPIGYPDRNDRAILISMAQHLWDLTDPETYIPFARDNYEWSAPKEFLYVISENDAQVPNLNSERAARTSDIPVMSGSTRISYGLDVQEGPIDGSGMVVFWGGDPGTPLINYPADSSYHSSAHNTIADADHVCNLVYNYMLTGVITDTCADRANGECTY